MLDGTRTLDEAIALDASRNIAFAKRQRTWFRAEPEIEWLEVGGSEEPDVRARAVVTRLLAGA